MPGTPTRYLKLALRWGVTLLFVGWVVSKIDWHDKVVLPNGAAIYGRVVQTPEGFEIYGNGGPPHSVPRAAASGPLSDDAPQPVYVPGFLTALKRIQPAIFLLAIPVYPLGILLSALRWHALMVSQGFELPWTQSVRLTWVGYFWNLVFPGVTGGDVVKAYYVARANQRKTEAITIVFLDRVIGIVAMAGLAATCILLHLHQSEFEGVKFIIFALFLTALAGGVLFYSRRLRRLIGLDRLLAALPFRSRIALVDQAIFHYRHHKHILVWAVALSIAAHLIMVLTFVLIGRSLNLPAAPINYFIFVPVIMIVSALPISAGGLGVMEGLFVQFFTLSGVGATATGALALSLLFRVVTIVTSIPGALVGLRHFAPPSTPADETVGVTVTASK